MTNSYDHDMQRAIEYSLLNSKEEKNEDIANLPEVVVPEVVVPEVVVPKGPPEPSVNPPRPGMTLKTSIKNGWVSREWV
jgi:hypothetical protein